MNLEDILYNKEMVWFKKKEETKGIAQLIDHLKEKNPNLPDSQIIRIANQIQAAPKDPSKRKSLQTIVKSAAGLVAAAALPQLLFSKKAQANSVKLPPGVSNCKDPALIEAYFLWHLNEPNSFGRDSDRQNARQIMGFDSRGYGGTMSLNPKSKFREPLYQLIVNEMKKENWVNFKELKKKNLPLAYFSGGIQDYFITFVNQDWWRYNMTRQDGIDEATNYFAKSFVIAAGLPESDYKTLLDKINSKTEDKFIINLRNKLTKQLYSDKLTAAWSSFYLTIIFGITQGGNAMEELNNNNIKTKAGFILNNLEAPAAKRLGHWIRGPPGSIT